jgi:hypothetical protein
VTEAPELLFFSGHGASSAHPSPSAVKKTIDNLSNLRDRLGSADACVLVVDTCCAGDAPLAASNSQTFVVRTEQSGNQLSFAISDAAGVRYAVQHNDGVIELAALDEDVVSPTDRALAAHNAASAGALGRLLSCSASSMSTRDDLIWPETSVRTPTPFGPWSRYTSAAVQPITLAQSFEYGCQGIVIVPCPPAQSLRDILGCRAFRLTFQEDALPTVGKGAFLRFIDGILAALRLMLVLVLTALSQQLAAHTLVLVILAACLRFGRREEPDNHAFLPMRRNQTSLGRCPLG